MKLTVQHFSSWRVGNATFFTVWPSLRKSVVDFQRVFRRILE
ncbi:hypothetical protein OROGR_009374 [Orobanche gracilis]